MAKKVKFKKQLKPLYEWAEDVLFSDEVAQFLQRCKQENCNPLGEISQDQFLKIKKRFGYGW